ncbi:MAG: elongation factor G [Chloroflexi bacterium]|nr:elongation factor G [Chloroflexota bacterium]MCY3581326.1 elongation factor G [Chloroflexota bacterium]MCY3716684.1 elongation factor G [Chloroflexota bacterium]MDE2649368.1 elongation factor G [Chloroflexota bacterium]MXV92359.1 elongation factor G [Chloroflexota bacterium]
MKEYQSDKIRNVALVGHQSSGKTSLVEALLYNTGATTRQGHISEGNMVSDWDDEERERSLSLSTSLVPVEFQDHKINILDTPGFTDFQGELKNAILVADAVIVVVDAVAGVEVGTELAWEFARLCEQPIMVVINKMDRDNADYDAVLEQLSGQFGDYKFIPVALPIGHNAPFDGVGNALTQKAYFGAGAERVDLPAEYADALEEANMALMEAAAEADDDLLEKYFEEETLSFDEIRDGMRKASRSTILKTVPVFAISATENIGTVPFLEALVAYTTAPAERNVAIERAGEADTLAAPQSDDDPLVAYVFKTLNDRFVGTLNYFRIFSGTISNDGRNINARSGADERFNALFVMRGKEQFPVKTLHAGDIGVVAKLSDTKTGDTFVDTDTSLRVTAPDFPAPLYMLAVNPRGQADSAKMGPTLSNLCDADPTLRWRQDSDTRQTVLEGMGQIHLEVTLKRAEALGVNIDTEMPKVPYRETITGNADSSYTHKKQTGGAGQYGRVDLKVEPAEDAFAFESKVFGGAISQQFVSSTEKGIRAVLPDGVIAGFPVERVKVIVFDGKEHPVDSKDIAFQIAGREAFRAAFRKAKPVLLEPIMDVRITVPEAMMGDIMSDLNTRRGRVQGMDTVGIKSIVTAEVPLAEMLRYGNDLRSMSGGRGIYTMDFNRYDRVPAYVQDEIIAAAESDEG